MIRYIKNHNYLNGLLFSFFEYLLVVIIIAPFLVYYLIHGRDLYALIAAGIIFNCLTVSYFALVSILKKEKSVGIVNLYNDRELRKKVGTKYPDLSRQTVILSLTVLIPFWIFGAVLFDRMLGKKS
jgi:hypothetical protein